MTALIAIASVFAYLGCLVYSARWRYQRIRPSTEPVGCETPYLCTPRLGGHSTRCYRRYGMIDTTNEAAGFAFLFGLLGPISFIGIALSRIMRAVIVSGTPLTRAELKAKVARLERELGMDDRS